MENKKLRIETRKNTKDIIVWHSTCRRRWLGANFGKVLARILQFEESYCTSSAFIVSTSRRLDRPPRFSPNWRTLVPQKYFLEERSQTPERSSHVFLLWNKTFSHPSCTFLRVQSLVSETPSLPNYLISKSTEGGEAGVK